MRRFASPHRLVGAAAVVAALALLIGFWWLRRGSVPPLIEAVLVGAGDIADCSREEDDATADLLDDIVDDIAGSLVEGVTTTVFTLGDNVYDDGARSEFAECYDPTWGRHRERTRPAPGNHDYDTDEAAGYYEYFGDAAGDPDEGWYSYDLGGWHVVVLNSNCDDLEGGCEADSPQLRWLGEDLSESDAQCTVAYWHHARFSSGTEHGSDNDVAPFWKVLYEHGAEIVLSGHEHNYERFAPQTPAGDADERFGIRQFVVGTGGKTPYEFRRTVLPNSERRHSGTPGVILLSLRSDGYQWRFVSADGAVFSDEGEGRCHGRPPRPG
ncbi:MAG: metallophosphoesterase family protein [Acidimicrobiia bacterium]